MIDIWRIKHSPKRQYTYIDPSNRGSNSRIDKFLISETLSYSVTSSEILHAPSPDHKALLIEISEKTSKRGKGYWKLNSSILKDTEYQTLIKELITDTTTKYDKHVTKCKLWQFLKLRIKEASIAYSIKKSKSKRDSIKQLEIELNVIDKTIAQSQINDNDIQKTRKLMKQQLDSLYADKAIGAQIRSRAKWIEEGEKSSAYFLNLEKKRQTANNIQSLKYKEKQSRDDTGILAICKDFYNDLYTSKKIPDKNIKTYMSNIKIPKKLTDVHKTNCEGKITITECDKVVKELKKNKSPGLDGLTAEFYQHFWSEIRTIVVDAFNESYDLGSLPESIRIAIMSLIFKKGDTEDLEN